MPKRDRFTYAALGFVAGLFLALLFLAWSVPDFRYPLNQQVSSETTGRNNAHEESEEPGQKPAWRYWTERFIVLEDTPAQWLMAVFSIVATVASIYAVLLLRDTLTETRAAVRAADDAVAETRRIGEAQVRAYLACTGAKYRIVNQLCVVTVAIRNSGQSPAKQATISGRLIAYNMDSVGNDDQFLRGPYRLTEMFAIPAAGEEDDTLLLQVPFAPDIRDELATGTRLIMVECTMVWTDVFNKQQSIQFFLIEQNSEFVYEANFPRRREGSMRAANNSPPTTLEQDS